MTEHCPACGYRLASARIPPDRAEVTRKLDPLLRPIERRVLHVLLAHFGETVSLEKMIEAIWPDPFNNVANELGAIRAHLCNLRKAMIAHDAPWVLIVAYKIGYVLRERNEDERIAWETAKAARGQDGRTANGRSRTRPRKTDAVQGEGSV